MKKKILFLMTLLNLLSCAHHRDVRPGAEGIHKVELQSESKSKGSRIALDQAQYFCEKRNQSAAIVKESANYTGDMDESTYKATKKASKIAEVIGGSSLLLGKETADTISGKGYTINLDFKCI